MCVSRIKEVETARAGIRICSCNRLALLRRVAFVVLWGIPLISTIFRVPILSAQPPPAVTTMKKARAGAPVIATSDVGDLLQKAQSGDAQAQISLAKELNSGTISPELCTQRPPRAVVSFG
jgi:hypothetical protein